MSSSIRLDSVAPTPKPTAGMQTRRLACFQERHGPLLAILAIGLAVRLALLAASGPVVPIIEDERHYATLATSILNGDGFAWGPGQTTSMRPPLYPLLLALTWAATGGESAAAVRAVQIGLSLLTVVGVYALALRLFDRRVATIAAAILAFYPSYLFAGVLLLTEVLFTFLLVMLALQYDALMRRPRAIVSVTAGATVGLAALTRSVLWPFPLVLVPLACLSVRATMSRRVIVGVCCAAGYLAVVGPWAVRNTRVQHTFTVVDTAGGMNLRLGNYEHTPEDRMWDAVALMGGEKSWSRNLSQVHPEAVGWTDGQKDRWAQREALAYMAANPGTTLRRMVLKFADFWGLEREMVAWFRITRQPLAWVVWPAVLATAIAYPLVALGAAIGAVCCRLTERRTHALILLVIAFMTGVHSVVFGHSRYHLPLVAFLAIYAAAGWVGWRSGTLVRSRRRVAVACLICAGLMTIWCHEVFGRDADRLRSLIGLWS